MAGLVNGNAQVLTDTPLNQIGVVFNEDFNSGAPR